MRLAVAVWLCMVMAAQAQEFPFEYWHEGKLVTEESDTLKGTIMYNLQGDILQLQRSGQIETYTARKIVFFEIFDVTSKQYRQFYSLPFSPTGTQYKAPVFFELLAEGKMTLLAREALEYRTYSSFYYYGSYSRQVLVYKYFLLDEKGDINQFEGNKNDWIYLMGKQGSQVQKYAKSNKLDFDQRDELVKIVTYYNSLFQRG